MYAQNILTVKHNRGLLDDSLDRLDVADNLYTQEHQDLAREAVRKSLVLLKNENKALPLSKDVKTITVIGPNANDRHFVLGNYFGTPSYSLKVPGYYCQIAPIITSKGI